ncbi:MAG: sulfite exporter TauE/SafE family protein [Albidovulum sp.]|nr:sulfite exporter TauE/SafE family protein [Albidovulum sp.]
MEILLAEGVTIPVVIFAVFVAAFAGFIKGSIGFGLPSIMIASLGAFLDPLLALAFLILPTFATNTVQAFRDGISGALSAIAKHWQLLVAFFITLLFSSQIATSIPKDVFFLLLGTPVTSFALLQLIRWRPRVPPGRRSACEFAAGAVAGFFGGLAGVWGPPVVFLLSALETPKREQVTAQGVIYLLGSLLLVPAHLNSGILNRDTLPLSLFLCIPAVAGLIAGFLVQDKLDQEKFRKITFIAVTLAGLNLIFRGVVL